MLYVCVRHSLKLIKNCLLLRSKWAVSYKGVCQKSFDYIPEIISLSYYKTELN